MNARQRTLLAAAALWAGSAAFAQTTGDRLTIPLSDPSRPALVKVNLITGGITVKTHAGKDVIVQVRSGQRDGGPERSPDGLRRIPINGAGIEAEEENNVVKIGAPPNQHTELEIQVPVRTSLKLKTINGGNILVQGVQGEIEAEDINGTVTLTDISGSAVAHALNGRVAVKFTQVDPQKSMSFSSLNGDIDVTFPADLKANVKLKADNGEVYSDFDLTVKASPQPATENAPRDSKGKYRVRIDRTVYGTINGGGPEIQFSNFNGSIYIRKAGK
jgi:hypothetical protein